MFIGVAGRGGKPIDGLFFQMKGALAALNYLNEYQTFEP
jgi:hypothetical protein